MYTITMHMYAIEFYETERGDNFVAEFLDGLPEKTRNKTLTWIAMLKKYGPDLKRPYADLLDGPIRELRVQFARDEVRLLYFFADTVIAHIPLIGNRVLPIFFASPQPFVTRITPEAPPAV
ncbi:MAG: type II toxin-antitoxin system RelE/ParE family toxin [Elusimicrobiota bacterium]|nr:type II toxin-antitoxin system RelE/ParE family toxin [Elusimicrobiota bacterium]